MQASPVPDEAAQVSPIPEAATRSIPAPENGTRASMETTPVHESPGVAAPSSRATKEIAPALDAVVVVPVTMVVGP